MLADEAFALHFLEDTFAAGHVAGAWGDVSQRKGTHDYYNAAGLEVFTWRGGSESMVLMGDAHMRPEDAERAASAVRISLEQLIDHAAGRECADARPAHPRSAGRARGVRRVQEQCPAATRRRACVRRRRSWRRLPEVLGADTGARVSARDSGRCRAFAPRWGRSSASSAPATCA